MDRERMVEEFIKLIKTDSPSLREARLAQVLEQTLLDLGLHPAYDRAAGALGANCGNLITRIPATAPGKPTVIINAHMDTVGPSEHITPVIRDDCMYSSGDTILGADCKSGLVVILETLRELTAHDFPRGEILVVFTIGEEIGLLGANALDYADIRADMAFVLDGGSVAGQLTTAAPYSDRLLYTVKGKAAHAGVRPEAGINSIQAAARGLAEMRIGRLDEETTANIGVIRGGTAANVVPARTVLHGEARSHRPEKLLAQTEHMNRCMQQGAAAQGAEVEIEQARAYDGFAVPDDAPPVAAATRAARSLGLAPQTSRGGGGSDANVFNVHGIPAIIMSTGANDPHCLEESLCITQMYDSAQWLSETLKAVNSAG